MNAPSALRRRTLFVVVAVLALALIGLAITFLPHLQSTAPADTRDPSIAVLPFTNLSSGKEQEYFSDGIAEDLLNLLTEVQTVKVAARTSSFSFQGQNLEIPEIARRLHVAHVLQGSVRKTGTQLRITATLVRAADGEALWSRSWDGQVDDVFKIQDEIAAAVMRELRVKLPGVELRANRVDPGAYPLILHAQALVNQGSIASYTEAIALYQQALELAPNESRTWAGMARAYFNLAVNAREPTLNGRLSKQAANKALSLDPDNVLAMVALGRMAGDFELDLPVAARYYERALELEPRNLIVLNAAAILLMDAGRLEESLSLFEYRVAYDPASPSAYNNLGNVLYYLKRWDAAIEAFRTALRLNPEYAGAHSSIALSLLLGKNDPAGALKEFEAESDPPSRQLGIPVALYALGRKDEAQATLREAVEKYQDEQATVIAANHAFFGDSDKAFEWLGRAVATHDPFLSSLVVEPLLLPLRDDPRWLPFLRRIGFAPEQLAAIDFHVTMPPQNGP